jgi:hypothetical protein
MQLLRVKAMPQYHTKDSLYRDVKVGHSRLTLPGLSFLKDRAGL